MICKRGGYCIVLHTCSQKLADWGARNKKELLCKYSRVHFDYNAIQQKEKINHGKGRLLTPMAESFMIINADQHLKKLGKMLQGSILLFLPYTWLSMTERRRELAMALL